MSNSKKNGYVPNTFHDAGTGEEFQGGKEHPFEPGAYENYRAGGLITDGPTAKAESKTEGGKAA